MSQRQERFDRMRAIQREFLSAQLAAEALEDKHRNEPGLLDRNGLRPRDLQHFRENLEGTYLIRLFAEFEAGLRQAWSEALGQTTLPRMSDLLQAFSARRLIPQDWLDGANSVREFRNSLVHEESLRVAPVSLKDSSQHLNRFFSFMPSDW